jgi:predicted permease
MLADFKFAFRQLAKAPGFALVVILSLALGIGANTTVFCWIQGILMNPLPGVMDQQRMVALTTTQYRQNYDTVSYPNLRDLQAQADVFSGVIGSQITPALLSVGADSRWLYGQIATANFFEVLGVRPIFGRTFLPGEDQKPGGNPVLVLSESAWRRSFGADPAIVGKMVELNLNQFTVIGVVPQAFAGTMSGLQCDFWAPVSMYGQVAHFGSLNSRGDHWLHVQARLRPGVNPSAAQAAVDTISKRLEGEYPNSNRGVRLRVLTMANAPYGAAAIFGRALVVLLIVSAGVLLIVIANVANLLLARAVVRRREISVRLALGADRRRLIRLLFVESLVLAVAGGLAGAALADWGIGLMNAWAPPTPLPLQIPVRADSLTLGFTIMLTLAVCFVAGFAPAWQASGTNPLSGLKGGSGLGTGSSRSRLKGVLVVTEFALAMIVLVGAGLCVTSYTRARHAYLGFKPDNVLLVGLRAGLNGYNSSTVQGFYAQLEQKLTTLPGVQATALNDWFPLGFESTGWHSVTVDGYDKTPGAFTGIMTTAVSPGYFSVLDIPLLAGRDFTDRDDEKAPRVAVINEAMARLFWPGRSALGRKFREWGREITVIGVVPTGKYRFINEPPREFYYLPYRQAPNLDMNVCLRSSQDPAVLAALVQRVVHEVDPRVEIWVTLKMADYIKAAYVAPVLAARILTCLAAAALVLAAMGVYGVMAYTVNQRTNEIGLRMALGARPGQILRWILYQGGRLALIGLGLGIAAAIGLARLTASLLYDTRVDDPSIYLGASLTLIAMASLACFLPARKAARVDPLTAIRAE